MQHLRKFNENRKARGHWSYQNVKEEALKFKRRSDFQKNSIGAYTTAHKNGWLDDVCSHMSKPYVWTYDKVKQEALKFNTRSDFKMNSLAYSVATRRGWLDDVCSHMKLQGNLYKKHIYKVLFTDNSIYIGLTYNFDKRVNDHLTSKKSSVYKHMIKTGLKPEFSLVTKDLISNEDAVKMECSVINHYRDLGFNILNMVKGGALGGCVVIWTYDTIKEEALKFKTRGDFQKFSGRAYAVARNNEVEFKDKSVNAYYSATRNGWLDDVCSHMIAGKKPNGYWTIDKVREEALKFSSRSEFKKKSSSAYSYALKNGWLDDVCSGY